MLQRLMAVIGACLLVAAPARAASVGAWSVDPMPEAKGSCRARLPGSEVNTTLLLNQSGGIVLSAANPGWNLTDRDAVMTVAVDGGSPVRLEAFAIGPLVMAGIDDGLLNQLRNGRSIDWILPHGRFQVPIPDFGAAVDALKACQTAP